MTTISNPKNSNPPYFAGSQYNPTTNNSGGSASTQSLVSQLTPYFLKFPSAQGQEFLSDVIVNGDLIVSDTNNQFVSNIDLNMKGNVLLDSSANYIQFGDGSRQYIAPPPDDINTVYNDISNTFIYPTIQTFQGSNATIPTTAPLRFSNVTSGEYGSLFVDPNPNNDLTIYSNQAGGGLTVSNPTNSFTINPTNVNTASFLNPIVSNASITAQSLGINTTGGDAYTVDSRAGFGLTIVNSTGNPAELTLSNGGPIAASITCTSGNLLDFNGASIALNGIGCQAISCTTLNTNANTITSGAINAGAITGSSLNTTGNITTASNGLGGTSVFNDTQCNFNAISCGGNVGAGSLTSTGAISGSQLTLSSGANTSILTTASDGLNINDPVVVAGSVSCQSISCSTLNSNGNTITSGAISCTGGIDMNNGGITELSSIQGNGASNITCNSSFLINPANALYASTITSANTNPIQMSGGAFLSTNPPSNSNDTTIATTSFVNTAICAIPSGALIQSGKVAGGWVNAIPNQGPNSAMYINGYFQMLTYTTITLPIPYGNTSYKAIACLSDLVNPPYEGGYTQWMGGVWHSTNINNTSQFTVYVFCSWRGSNSGIGNPLPSYNISWITYP
jgi:hypothetical protein